MKKRQLGFLYEIPLLVMITGTIAAILWHRLSSPLDWVSIAPFAGASAYFLYHVMIRRR